MEIKDKALTLLREDRNEDLKALIEYSKLTTETELIYLLMLIHLNRISRVDTNKGQLISKFFIEEFKCPLEDTLIYLVSLCVKYGKKRFRDPRFLPLNYISSMIEGCNQIHSKYYHEIFVHLYKVLDCTETRITFENTLKEETLGNEFLKYILRVSEDNKVRGTAVNIDELEAIIYKEFRCFDNLLQKAFNINVRLYIEFIRNIANSFGARVFANINILTGKVDITDPVVFDKYWRCFIFSYEELYNYAGKSDELLRRLLFDVDDFKEEELKYHYIVRKPIIKLSNDYFIISPQVLINSVYWNIHFWLLEEKSVSEEYKAQQSDRFLDRIRELATYANYYEVTRNKYIKDKNKDLGDIDLILKNEQGQFLIVEGKNERLPLDVYFGSYQDILARLQQTKSWEDKVTKRNNYLKDHCHDFNISPNFKYVIISNYPEVLSHFSSYLVLSLYEFEQWATWGFPEVSFQDFYSYVYRKAEIKNDEVDINKINDFGYTIFKAQDAK